MPLSASRAGTGRLGLKSAFAYDVETNTCPRGKALLRGGTRGKAKANRSTGTVSCCASRRGCGPCPDREACAPHGVRRLDRSVHEPDRDRAAARAKTRAFRWAQASRLCVERLFAHDPSTTMASTVSDCED